MPTEDPFAQSPRQVRASTERATPLYVRKPGCYAVHGRKPGTPAPAAIALLNDGMIAVFQGAPDANVTTASAEAIGPVYELEPGELLAVPTGLVFVRFAEGVPAQSHSGEIDRAGYALVESPPYAPHAAWLRAGSGTIADALANISALEQLPDVANVEPQMLMERSKRS